MDKYTRAVLLGLTLIPLRIEPAQSQETSQETWRLLGAVAGQAQPSTHHVHYWYARVGTAGTATHRACASRGSNDQETPTWLGCTDFNPRALAGLESSSARRAMPFAMTPAVVSVNGVSQNADTTVSYLVYIAEGIPQPGQPPGSIQIYCKAAVLVGSAPDVKCGRNPL
jgi:hypothetical protein